MKKLIEKAKSILEEYQGLRDDMRNYDYNPWHAVCVKRYNDQVDLNDIVNNPKDYKEYFFNNDDAKFIKKYKNEISEHFDDEYIDSNWYSWLETEGDQLRYEISDIKEITKESKDEHKSFEHITCLNHNNDNIIEKNYINFLGRSGGWACFKDDNEDIAEDIEYCINNPKDAKEDGSMHDLEDNIKILTETVEEINYLKDFIEKFNNNMNFKYEILYRISEYTEELENETISLEENKDHLIVDIKNLNENMITRLNKHKKNKILVKKIKEQAKIINSLLINK